MSEGKKKKTKIVVIIAALVLLAVLVILFFWWRSKISATTMRIIRIEGDVSLEEDGLPKTVKDNLRLKSGDALSTALQSLVSIGLDDTKIVTLNENSRAQFNQSGRKLDLKLTAGSLYFEVSEPLTQEETFDIRTSTMVVGIRGTSGIVSVDGEHESLIICDGMVHVIGTNPVTGEVKEIDVKAGQRITVYLYNDRDVDSIEFFLEDITEHELPEFGLRYLREHLQLLDKVCSETGWDKEWILGIQPESTPDTGDDGSDGKNDDAVIPAIDNEPPTPKAPLTDGSDNSGKTGNKGIIVKLPTPEQLEKAKNAIVATKEDGVVTLSVGTDFDPKWYAETYPDVVRVYGTDTAALVAHYLDYGRKEGRLPLPPVITASPTPSFDPNANVENKRSSHDDDEEEPEPSPTPTTNPVVNNVSLGGFTTDTNPKQAKLMDGTSVTVVNYVLGNSAASIISFDTTPSTTVTLPIDFTGEGSNAGETMTVPKLSNISWADTADGTTVTWNDGATTWTATKTSSTAYTVSDGASQTYSYNSGGNFRQFLINNSW